MLAPAHGGAGHGDLEVGTSFRHDSGPIEAWESMAELTTTLSAYTLKQLWHKHGYRCRWHRQRCNPAMGSTFQCTLYGRDKKEKPMSFMATRES
jgi:hypothetical protein